MTRCSDKLMARAHISVTKTTEVFLHSQNLRLRTWETSLLRKVKSWKWSTMSIAMETCSSLLLAPNFKTLFTPSTLSKMRYTKRFGETVASHQEICKLKIYNKYSKGNGGETVGYGVDGEASDWLFTNFQIISASPELGTNDFHSNSFYVEDRPTVLSILS